MAPVKRQIMERIPTPDALRMLRDGERIDYAHENGAWRVVEDVAAIVTSTRYGPAHAAAPRRRRHPRPRSAPSPLPDRDSVPAVGNLEGADDFVLVTRDDCSD